MAPIMKTIHPIMVTLPSVSKASPTSAASGGGAHERRSGRRAKRIGCLGGARGALQMEQRIEERATWRAKATKSDYYLIYTFDFMVAYQRFSRNIR